MFYYSRQIVYLDFMEAGHKIRNAGFLKLEELEGEVKWNIRIKGIHEAESGFYEIRDETGSVVDKLLLKQGEGSYTRQFARGTMTRGGRPWEEICGIRIDLTAQKGLEGNWCRKEAMSGEKSVPANTDGNAGREKKAPFRKEYPDFPTRKKTEYEDVRTEAGIRPKEYGSPSELEASREKQWDQEGLRRSKSLSQGEPERAKSWGQEKQGQRKSWNQGEPEQAKSWGQEEQGQRKSWNQREPEQAESWGQEEQGQSKSWSQGEPEQAKSWGQEEQGQRNAWNQREPERAKSWGQEEQGQRKSWRQEEPDRARRWVQEAMDQEERVTARREENQNSVDWQRTREPIIRKGPQVAALRQEVRGGSNRKEVLEAAGIEETKSGLSEGKTGKEGEDVLPSRDELYEDKWEQLQHMYRTVHPFGDDRAFLSIAPKDFIILEKEFQKMVHNSFLLHGYYNYRHIILGKISQGGDEAFYLGVPGVYYDREKMAAEMFGFEAFEGKHAPAKQGSFGYYMKRVRI